MPRLLDYASRLLDNDWFLNLLPLLVVGALLYGIVRAGRTPLWGEAYRRLRGNLLALLALSVVMLYASVGVADSIGWHDDANGPRRSLIDRAFQRPAEPTYSAPLATHTTGEPRPRRLKGRHWLGTDGVGQDVFYQTLKGVRTGFIIGGLTLLLATPLALLTGMAAGYFGKTLDDFVLYVIAVLSSVPNILLLIALILILGRGLPQLCFALGVTSWVDLARLTRGETLKHRDREYVRAARALGLSHGRILFRHILPNLLPIVIISTTLGFSGLVLSEAVLSYLQLGVDASTGSWGNMIDASRLELAREPVIWWNLTAASVALFILVLAFNIFGDALRDAIDPRLQS